MSIPFDIHSNCVFKKFLVHLKKSIFFPNSSDSEKTLIVTEEFDLKVKQVSFVISQQHFFG